MEFIARHADRIWPSGFHSGGPFALLMLPAIGLAATISWLPVVAIVDWIQHAVRRTA